MAGITLLVQPVASAGGGDVVIDFSTLIESLSGSFAVSARVVKQLYAHVLHMISIEASGDQTSCCDGFWTFIERPASGETPRSLPCAIWMLILTI